MPSHASADRGHYSRWKASSTTFGPASKVGASVVLVAVLTTGFFLVFFIIWFVQLFLTGWILRELWRPAWIVPTADGDASRPSPADPVEPLREGFRVPPPPERAEPIPDRPRTAGEKAGLLLLVIVGGALVTVFTVETDEMRVGAIMLATLLGMYAFFRSFLS